MELAVNDDGVVETPEGTGEFELVEAGSPLGDDDPVGANDDARIIVKVYQRFVPRRAHAVLRPSVRKGPAAR